MHMDLKTAHVVEHENREIINFNELRPGDKVIGSNGEPIEVTHVYSSHIPEEMYEIEMSNGEIIKCSGNHLWYTETTDDEEEKEVYKLSFNEYVENYSLPEYSSANAHYPIEIMSDKFASDDFSRNIIARICLSMGHSGETPNAYFDGLTYLGDEMIQLYSVNSFIDFVKNMDNYFYFGKVRTTTELFKLMENGYNINIPERGEVKE